MDATIAAAKLEGEYSAAFGAGDSDSTDNSGAAKAATPGPREGRPKKAQTKARRGLLHSRHLRRFTVQCIEEAEFIMLTLDQLEELRGAFPEVYDDIFANQDYTLWLTLRAKQRALDLLDPTERPEVHLQRGKTRRDLQEAASAAVAAG